MIGDQETIKQLVDLIERFVRERLVPIEERLATEGRLPDDILEEMKALGSSGSPFRKSTAVSATMEGNLVSIAMGRTSRFRSIMGTNNGIGSATVVFNGTEEQKQKYLPKYASGEWISCFCLTVQAGSDAASLKTTAVRDGDHYFSMEPSAISPIPRVATFNVMSRPTQTIRARHLFFHR